LGFLVFFAAFFTVEAYHIAGADFYYNYLGNHRYELRFRMYRDCSLDGSGLPVAYFDDEIEFFIFKSATKELVKVVKAPRPREILYVTPGDAVFCISALPPVCLQVGTYVAIVELPPIPGGYDIGWQRCCRNSNVMNLYNSNAQGATFLVHIPGTEAFPTNSSPRFKDWPPLFLCRNTVFHYDHSAIDPDGDSLVYTIFTPYTGESFTGQGVSQSNPVVSFGINPMGPPPYLSVTYAPGYSALLPFGNGGIFSIDRQTGLLEVSSPQNGLFTVAVAVDEYRNGVYQSTVFRDMQFIFVDCNQILPPPTLVPYFDTLAYSKVGDTLYFYPGITQCYEVEVIPAQSGLVPAWQLKAVPASSVQVTIVSNDPPRVKICWSPECAFEGGVVPIVFSAWQPQRCPYYRYVYDTVWIRILSPPDPVLWSDFQFLNSSPPDTLSLGDTVCMAFVVGVTEPSPFFTHYLITPQTGINLTYTVQSDSLVSGTLCWEANCTGVNQPVVFTLLGLNRAPCRTPKTTLQSLSVTVRAPQNPMPVVMLTVDSATAFSVSGDTAWVWADSTLCYSFTVVDSQPASHHLFSYSLYRLPGFVPLGTDSSVVFTLVKNEADTFLQGKLCIPVTCDFYPDTIAMVFTVSDSGACTIDHVWQDTVYLIPLQKRNAPPFLFSDYSGDTVVVIADSVLCYRFTAVDTGDFKGFLYVVSVHILDTTLNPPQVQITGQTDSSLTGQVCWHAPCSHFYRYIPLVLTVGDSNTCTLDHIVSDTVIVFIVERPLDPIQIAYDPSPFAQVGDTIYIPVKRRTCVQVTVSDTGNQGVVWVAGAGPLFDGIPPDAQWTNTNGIAILTTQLCWENPCEMKDTLLPVWLWGYSLPQCADTLFDTLSFFLRVFNPENHPPLLIRSIPSPYAAQIGDSLCYTIEIVDPDPYLLYEVSQTSIHFQPDFGYGSNVVITSVDTLAPNRIRYSFCIRPNCYIRRDTLRIQFCVRDTTNCTDPYEVCDELVLQVQNCQLVMPNVITPNGDGINDAFYPMDMLGIQDYELCIYDRWGRELFCGHGPWYPDATLSAGVYFYRIRFQMDSGTGPLLLREQYGSFTLLK
jgi:hypothetical protein